MKQLKIIIRLLMVPGSLLTMGCTQIDHTWNDAPMPEKPDQTCKLGEFRNHVLESDGETFRCVVYVPDDYSPETRWPAFLFLHGSGERGSDGIKQSTVGLGRAIREHPERFPCIAIMPQCPGDRRWEGPMESVALNILQQSINQYRIDPDRIVLTGLSLGGYGTWSIGSQDAAMFAAMVPICGGGDPQNVDQLKTIPIWCFHGDKDNVVPVSRSREMVEAIRAIGGNIQYTEYPGVKHNSWDPTYGDADVIAWMLDQHR